MNTKTMEEILNGSVFESSVGLKTAAAVGKNTYDQLTQHKNLLTYSTTDLFHSCPRKFQIKKLKAATGTQQRITNVTFAFGHAVGAGVAVFDKTQSLEEAIWAAFLAWDMDLLAEERRTPGSNGKSFYEAVWALYAYRNFYETSDLPDYETVNIEATIALDFENGQFYSGHVDELLRNKYTGRYRVKENKTTSFRNVDAALYSNSDQALSYAVVIDMLGGAEYEVLYTIYSTAAQEWIAMPFVKSALKKAEWIQDQLLTADQIATYSALDFFPKRGRNCFAFSRRCEEYETCDLSLSGVYPIRFSELPEIKSVADIDAIEKVDYSVKLSELVARQRALVSGGGSSHD